jgi:anti-sigma B factor antagonist
MAVEVRESELSSEVRVVQLSGRLDMEATQADSPAVQEALEQSAGGIVVDMGAVGFLSSSGLRMLLAVHQKAQGADKKIALVGVQPPIYKIFKVSALDDLFPFFENERDAVEALWQ